MEAKIEYNNAAYNVVLFDGKPLAETPSSYKKVGVFGHNLGYNGIGDLYTAKDGSFRYGIYRDGCFYPHYGKLVFLGIINVPILGDKRWFVLSGENENETNGLTKGEAVKMATKLRDKNTKFYIGMNKYICGVKKYAFCNLNDLIEQVETDRKNTEYIHI